LPGRATSESIQIGAPSSELGSIRSREDGDGAVRLGPRLFDESDAPLDERGMVALEVIRVEEQENPAASLRADGPSLKLVGGFRKQQAAPARPQRRRDGPAFSRADGRVLHEREAQLLREVRDGFVLVADDQSH
jgi:hypothetical protein